MKLIFLLIPLILVLLFTTFSFSFKKEVEVESPANKILESLWQVGENRFQPLVQEIKMIRENETYKEYFMTEKLGVPFTSFCFNVTVKLKSTLWRSKMRMETKIEAQGCSFSHFFQLYPRERATGVEDSMEGNCFLALLPFTKYTASNAHDKLLHNLKRKMEEK